MYGEFVPSTARKFNTTVASINIMFNLRSKADGNRSATLSMTISFPELACRAGRTAEGFPQGMFPEPDALRSRISR